MTRAARHALTATLLLLSVDGASALPCGPGGLALPGTTTCLRLGGVVRAEAATRAAPAIVAPAPDGGRGRSVATLRAGARVDLDARTPTPYGPLRAYMAVRTDGLDRR